MNKKLYKIWRVASGATKDSKIPWVEYDPGRGTWAYPLEKVLDAYPRFYREDVVNLDRAKLQKNCDYLNEIADDNVRYEIRGEGRDE